MHFLNDNVWISLKISRKFGTIKCPIYNNPALIKIMAWRRSGDKPLSETMMVSLLTHICVTRPRWVKGTNSVIETICVYVVAYVFSLFAGYNVAQSVYLGSVLSRTSEKLDYRLILESAICLRGPTRMLSMGKLNSYAGESLNFSVQTRESFYRDICKSSYMIT